MTNFASVSSIQISDHRWVNLSCRGDLEVSLQNIRGREDVARAEVKRLRPIFLTQPASEQNAPLEGWLLKSEMELAKASYQATQLEIALGKEISQEVFDEKKVSAREATEDFNRWERWWKPQS